MKARIIKNGKIIGGKLADIFVRVGVAEYVEDIIELEEDSDDIEDQVFANENVVKKQKTVKKRGRKKK